MKQLHPRAVWLFFFQGNLIALILGLIIATFLLGILSLIIGIETFRETLTAITRPYLILICSFLTAAYIRAKLLYRSYRYQLTNDGFRKESGIIWKHYVTIPYNRIQNVDIYRSIWDRIFELSDLQIQTAGMNSTGRYGKTSQERLQGLSVEEAEKLRDDLLHQVCQSKNQGL